MNSDICKCGKELKDHNGALSECLNFQLDRKATWNAEKDRARWAKMHKRRERVEAFLGRLKAQRAS